VTTYRRVVAVCTTVRYELKAPVSGKDLSGILSTLAQEYNVKNGRTLKYDNDYWLEPTDDGVAFCFLIEEVKSDDEEEDSEGIDLDQRNRETSSSRLVRTVKEILTEQEERTRAARTVWAIPAGYEGGLEE
jgi:hypothetical protein